MNRQRNPIKNWFVNLKRGYRWLTDKVWLLVLLFLACMSVTLQIAWHTEQAICYFLGVTHLYGATYLIALILGGILLLHEAEYIWKHKWMKILIGLLSVYFIYYCFLDALWWLVELLFRIPIAVSSFGTLLINITSAILVVVGYRNATNIRKKSYRIALGNTGKIFRIALVSDIHLGAFVGLNHVKKIVDAIAATQPDLVVIAGDLIDEDNSILSDPSEMNHIANTFRQIRSKHGTVLTLGNHDPGTDNIAFRNFLEKCCITLLHNRVMELPPINVIGISDPTSNVRKPIADILPELDAKKPTVVIDHDPRYAEEAAQQNADLVLSGHTHAGQFFPATVATRIAVGKQKLYGHHQIGNSHSIITSGAGIFNLPIRLGTYNEVVELIIVL